MRVSTVGRRPHLLDRHELAEALRVSVGAVDLLVHRPEQPLPHFRAGRKFLFDLSEVLRHLRQGGER